MFGKIMLKFKIQEKRNKKRITNWRWNGTDKKIQFFVRDLQKSSLVIRMPANSLLSEIKEKIKEKTGLKAEAQRLMFTGKYLHEHKTLEFYGVNDNSNIYLLTRLREIFKTWPRTACGLKIFYNLKNKSYQKKNNEFYHNLLY